MLLKILHFPLAFKIGIHIVIGTTLAIIDIINIMYYIIIIMTLPILYLYFYYKWLQILIYAEGKCKFLRSTLKTFISTKNHDKGSVSIDMHAYSQSEFREFTDSSR